MSYDEKVIDALNAAISVLEKAPVNPPNKGEPSNTIRKLMREVRKLTLKKYPQASKYIFPD
ncbi:hypothetical protein EGD75_19795 [Escherichia coli]|uniref:hypothetical protein n=1 Tax=Escherichia coli TaxID=562 RepID=UPI0005426DA4|nr:hypothetical protein [Escherichia coli]EEV5604834.1 hypothetical protein [Escherichia coli]EEV9022297.1 hypothetical protein [Escherichia coli]EEX1963029.1 hypothetical protein [Escherichia coli]EEZ4493476.1 hypothetical protein [Escherichia coli]EEZ5625155.1 hypothetical protein [Escherichia coli]